jgi:gamma-glutamyl-gamma-aminobutyrate hydrolase PuuD
MNKILITQRVDYISDYDEKRDAIDQRWTDFLMSIELFPVFASNNKLHVETILKNEVINGVILTGGGSLAKYGGVSPERDQVEKYILQWAINNDIPLLGICRGMQFLQDYFEIPLDIVNGHVGIRHKLNVKKDLKLTKFLEKYIDVNSFHNLGTKQSTNSLLASSTSKDGVVMSLEHSNINVFGIMWHSERENPFKEEDKNLFRHIFC